MAQITFNKDGITVSTALLKTGRRSYRISEIEKIAIKRPLFWFSLPIAVGSFALLSNFRFYLYEFEQWLCLAGFIVLPVIGWSIATLNVTSKAYTNDVAAIGWVSTLSEARTALDKVILTNTEAADVVSHEL